MSAILLDTSGYRAMRRNHPQVVGALETADIIGVTPVVLGELLSGFDGMNASVNREGLREFIDAQRVRIYALDAETPEYYASIYDFLRKQGTPVSPNDLWIAASAMQHGLKIVTLDRDYLKIPHVRVDCFDLR